MVAVVDLWSRVGSEGNLDNSSHRQYIICEASGTEIRDLRSRFVLSESAKQHTSIPVASWNPERETVGRSQQLYSDHNRTVV